MRSRPDGIVEEALCSNGGLSADVLVLAVPRIYSQMPFCFVRAAFCRLDPVQLDYGAKTQGREYMSGGTYGNLAGDLKGELKPPSPEGMGPIQRCRRSSGSSDGGPGCAASPIRLISSTGPSKVL